MLRPKQKLHGTNENSEMTLHMCGYSVTRECEEQLSVVLETFSTKKLFFWLLLKNYNSQMIVSTLKRRIKSYGVEKLVSELEKEFLWFCFSRSL